MKKRGFTLTELLTTIAIIAILATVTVVGFVTYITKTQNSKADTESTQINKYIDGMRIIDNTLYVGTDENEGRVWIESIDGIFFITAESAWDVNGENKIFEISPRSSDLTNISGKIIIEPMEHFYLDATVGGTPVRRYIGTAKYVSDNGLERDIPLNNADMELLRLDLQAKAVEELMVKLITSEDSSIVILGETTVKYDRYDPGIGYKEVRTQATVSLKKLFGSVELRINPFPKEGKVKSIESNESTPEILSDILVRFNGQLCLIHDDEECIGLTFEYLDTKNTKPIELLSNK